MKRILIILLSILFITSISYAGVVSNIVGGGGGGTGASVTLDTSSFGTNLSAADTTVQKALDTLDEAAGSGAPTTAHYLTDQAEDGLSAEVIVSANGKSLVTAADYAAMKGLLDIDDVITLSGLAAGSVNLGEFTGSTITDNQTVKAALQLLESAVEGKQAADADLTDLADGSLTASKVAGVVDADYGDVIVSSGAWAVEDDSHAHTSSSISGLDISADTNLTAGDHITLTDDDLDIDDDFLLNNGDVGTGVYDFGGATRFEIPNSATLPETCTVGDIYTDTDADTNGSLYICVSANTWKEVDDDGGAGGMATTDIDTSAEIATIVTDEVGSGALAFATSTPFTTSITPNSAGASTLGTTALEWGNVYLTDSAVIYGQADQSNSLTSSATGWTTNLDLTVSGGNINFGNIAGVLGDATTDSVTVTTDGTGDAEVVLPTGAIATGEILNATLIDEDMANNALDPDKLVGDGTDDDKVDQDIIEGFGASATPEIILADSDADAAGTGDIKVDALTAGQVSTFRVYVDEDDAEDVLYMSLGGTAETILLGKSLTFTDGDVSPDAVGELVYDNTVTGLLDGAFAWYDDDSIRYFVDLAALPSDDDYVVAYDADADGFYMKADAGSGASGTVTTLKEATSQVGGADIVSVDFGAGFDLAEDPDTEINVTLDLTEYTGAAIGSTSGEITNIYMGDSAVIYGQADQSNTMTSSATGFSVNLPFGLMSSDDPDVAAAGKITHDTDGWLRVYDNSLQKALSLMYEVQVTIIKPNDLADAQRDAFLVYSNETGMNFVITGWKGWSDVDDTTLNIETTAADGQTNATVDAVELATNGTGVYTGADTSITAGTIANGSLIWLDFDDTDTPGIVHMTIYGYLAGDVN